MLTLTFLGTATMAFIAFLGSIGPLVITGIVGFFSILVGLFGFAIIGPAIINMLFEFISGIFG